MTSLEIGTRPTLQRQGQKGLSLAKEPMPQTKVLLKHRPPPDSLVVPSCCAQPASPAHPCTSLPARTQERTDDTFATRGRCTRGAKNRLQFPWASEKMGEERAQARRESAGESCHGGFLTLAGLGDHSLPREEDHLSWEERVPFHGRPLWPLAPSRRALPNSQPVCCLSSLRSPWKNS